MNTKMTAHYSKYSGEYKMKIVKEYLENQRSYEELAQKYHLENRYLIQRWVKIYQEKGENCFANKKRSITVEQSKLLEEWDFDKNEGVNPSNYTIGSSKSVWWKCKIGHEWPAVIASRKRSGCPFCSNQKVLIGYNDLRTTHPKLAEEYNHEKNRPIEEYTGGANAKVWWKCKQGHEWQAYIGTRSSQGTNCPVCSNRKILVGFNDVATTHPHLLNEWHKTKNAIKPTEISAGSAKYIWWKYKKCGREWKTPLRERTLHNRGCSDCHKWLQFSFNEKAIFYYLKQIFPTIKENYKLGMQNREIDIYIDELRLGIEYDGFWHQKIEKDIKKDEICRKKGITLIRIRDKANPKLNSSSIQYYINDANEKEVEKAIRYLVRFINQKYSRNDTVNPSIKKDRQAIYKIMEMKRLKNSFGAMYPELLKEWDMEKNGLDPYSITAKNHRSIWWKCKKGHSWEAILSNRTDKHQGCPICSNHKVLAGYNDVATKNPEVVVDWDYKKNGNNTPQNVIYGSTTQVYWKCDICGHEWKSEVRQRTKQGTGCLVCSYKRRRNKGVIEI